MLIPPFLLSRPEICLPPQGSPVNAPTPQQREALKNQAVDWLMQHKRDVFADDFAMFTYLHATWPYNFELTAADKSKLIRKGYPADIVDDFEAKGLWIRPPNSMPLANQRTPSQRHERRILENSSGDSMLRIEHRCDDSNTFKICSLVFVNQATHRLFLIHLDFDPNETENLNFFTTRIPKGSKQPSSNVLAIQKVKSRGRYGQHLTDYYDRAHLLYPHPQNTDKRRHDIWKADHSFTGTSTLYTKKLGGPNNKPASIMVKQSWDSAVNLTLEESGAAHKLGVFYCYAYRTFDGALEEKCAKFNSSSIGGFYDIGGDTDGLKEQPYGSKAAKLKLQLNNGEVIEVNTNNYFGFKTKLEHGAKYHVKIVQQPAGQKCTIAFEKGTAKGNVSDVKVKCGNAISGEVVGLKTGSVVWLQLNGGEEISVEQNGGLAFEKFVSYDQYYSVKVSKQPSNQECIVKRGSGQYKGKPANILVDCRAQGELKGTAQGLKAAVTLSMNGQQTTVYNDGGFTFRGKLADDEEYNVKIESTGNQSCRLTGAKGKFKKGKSNVKLKCQPKNSNNQSQQPSLPTTKTPVKKPPVKAPKPAVKPTGKKGFSVKLIISGDDIPKAHRKTYTYKSMLGRIGQRKDKQGKVHYNIYIFDDNPKNPPSKKFFVSFNIYDSNLFKSHEFDTNRTNGNNVLTGYLA